MEIDDTLLEQLAVDVFTGMLGMPIIPAPGLSSASDRLMASIRISGDWQAGLEVATPRAGARRIAQEMFGLPDEELGDAELSDALGEIANMIGGNLKGLNPGETCLSLPCVGPVVEQDWSVITSSVLELHLQRTGEPLTLRLYQIPSLPRPGTAGSEPLIMTCQS